jgi:hypothetical protein
MVNVKMHLVKKKKIPIVLIKCCLVRLDHMLQIFREPKTSA